MNKIHVIQEAQKGNPEAYRELMTMLEPRVARIVHGLLGPGQEAEDVGQETFIRLFKALPQFRFESSIETYVTRIAINLSLNEIKRRKRFWALFKDSKKPVEQLPDFQSQEDHETISTVHEALQKLKPKHRTVIALRFMEGYSTRETAEILEIPQGTVLSRVARGQEQLKKYLQPLYDGKES